MFCSIRRSVCLDLMVKYFDMDQKGGTKVHSTHTGSNSWNSYQIRIKSSVNIDIIRNLFVINYSVCTEDGNTSSTRSPDIGDILPSVSLDFKMCLLDTLEFFQY